MARPMVKKKSEGERKNKDLWKKWRDLIAF
jgi:hypothetical protein